VALKFLLANVEGQSKIRKRSGRWANSGRHSISGDTKTSVCS
jgi:hypothetical protein